MLSMKDLVFKERLAKKLVDQFIGPYIIEEVVSTNTVKLWLLTLIRKHLVVNISQVVWYKDQVREQKKEEVKPIIVEGVKEQKVEKILNKRKIRGVIKYLVCWKGFTVKHDSQKKEMDLENAKELVVEFEQRVNAEVRKQEKMDWAEERDFRKGELPGKHMVKILYRWDNRKFKNEYLKKLERNQWN